MMNADGSGLHRVTHTPNRDEEWPDWSPDGRWIAYGVDGSFNGISSTHIYVARPNGSGRRLLTHPCHRPRTNALPIWLPG